MKKYNHIVKSSTAKYSSIIKYLKYISSDWFDNNLISEISLNFDIMSISTSSAKTLNDWHEDKYLTMIWEKEYTVIDIDINEIKNRLGIDKETKLNIIGI